MKLSEWMARERITAPRLAKKLGVAAQTVRNIAEGGGTPTLLVAARIEAVTAGAITILSHIKESERANLRKLRKEAEGGA